MNIGRRRVALTVAAGAIGVGVGVAVGVYKREDAAAPATAEAAAVQRLRTRVFSGLDGKSFTLSELEAGLIIVNFWATWCTPCREEMPDFVQLQSLIVDKSIQFIGIAIDREDPVRKFTKEISVNYPIALADVAMLDATSSMGNSNQALPFSLVLDRTGAVLLKRLGKLSTEEIRALSLKSR